MAADIKLQETSFDLHDLLDSHIHALVRNVWISAPDCSSDSHFVNLTHPIDNTIHRQRSVFLSPRLSFPYPRLALDRSRRRRCLHAAPRLPV